MITKICIKCGVEKQIEFFHICKQGRHGRHNACKGCRKIQADARSEQKAEYDRARYMANPELSKEQSNKWRLANPKRRAEIYRLSSMRNPDARRKRVRDYRKRNPEKYKAHYLVKEALKSGRLKRQPCKECGEVNHVHGHHPDYTRPLYVIWLCAKHHHYIHNKEVAK